MCAYIPAKTNYEHLPSDVIKHLISFHAIKQCNTTSYVSGYTKRTARKVFLENPGLLADAGFGIMTENTLSSAEEFICSLCGVSQIASVDAARHILFPGKETQKICCSQVMH